MIHTVRGPFISSISPTGVRRRDNDRMSARQTCTLIQKGKEMNVKKSPLLISDSIHIADDWSEGMLLGEVS